VAPIYAEDADDLYQVVKTLEVSALELAWHSLGKAALEQLEVSNDVMKQAVEQHDALQALRADNEFHEVWIRESGNRELARILRDVKAKIRRIEIRYFNSEDAACSVDEHARIIQALGKQKREEAVILLQENWAADTGRLVKRPPIGSESV
jgi:DNA-binding GntR family transcriptional regulator